RGDHTPSSVLAVSLSASASASFRLRVDNYGRVYQSFRFRVENVRPRDARGRLPGARRQAPGTALAARQGSLRTRLVPPGRIPRRERDARGVDPPTPGREGGRAGGAG